ncbi:DUF5694 domain-containing protein [Robertkochia flava]|uniref:DUF5694 domain-containing protein n=1 Tax=Robertkochia flava TaxID=3447986 RepID=UPI001CCA6F0A|nr:DUF5694 domain-containing protein [Robertkochia marina]
MKLKNVFPVMICFLSLIPLKAQDPLEQYNRAFAEIKDQQAELLVLGSFHFKDAGLDGYKPQHDINIMSEEKQAELAVMLEDLKVFNPNKIAIEVRKEDQPRVDSLYQAYLKGDLKLKSNEIYQVAFRLGKMLGHKKLYAVDAPARSFKEEGGDAFHNEKQAYYIGKASPEALRYEQQIDSSFFKFYQAEDLMKTQVPLKTFFKYMNHPEVLRVSHGHYVMGSFKMGEGTDYYGADSAVWWYNRNMRIFHNLLQIKAPGDRVMLLIGAGHAPIINFQADASFDFNLVPVSEVLK